MLSKEKLDDYIQMESNFLKDKIEKQIEEELFSMFSNSDTTSCINSDKSFTAKDLEDLIFQVRPYQKENVFDLYNIDYMPMIELDMEEAKSNMFKYLPNYGLKLMKPTRTIYITQQKRKHKKKRINKKWAKIYGFEKIRREVPGYFINDVFA